MGKIGDFFIGFNRGQKDFGETIAAIVNSALLSVVYAFGVGSTSIVAKIFGKKFIDLKPSDKIESYWEELNLTSERPKEVYFRQF